MLVLRLQRTGRKNDATYRVVVTEKSAPMKSGELEIIGHYLPSRKPSVFECDQERATYWIGKGALPSDTVARHLKKAGLKDMDKYFTKYTKKISKSAPPPAAAPAPAPAAAPAEAPKAEAPAEEKKEEAPAATEEAKA